jgi:1,4-alpha-glucan branching enzyme
VRAATPLPAETIAAIVEGRHGDPFAVLGTHDANGTVVVRAFVPGAETVDVLTRGGEQVARLTRRHAAGFFDSELPQRIRYRLRATNAKATWFVDDPYAYGPVLGPLDDWLIGQGAHAELYNRLGAHTMDHECTAGVHFAVWAPRAQRVSVVGDFNAWDGRCHVMRKRVDTGVWEIFVPGRSDGTLYKYEIIGADGALLPLKADPVGFGAEMRPSTASIVRTTTAYGWSDGDWMAARAAADPRRTPMAIYEVHLGSWRRGEGNRWLGYDELADALIPYAVDMGFTRLELMPVNEHPLDASWGYQPIGLFAPTSRFGEPAAFARFVDRAHRAGLGVLLDWVPAHFPVDPHGLARFDGSALYEHEDPRQGFHPDWNTAIFNFGRNEVANYLTANALFWLDRYHIDGLRVDAVASMLYLDYSREAGEWVPNRAGGNQNLEAIAFLRRLSELVYARHAGAITIAEESTAWPGVSQPTYTGGLGFGFKWNMGWMHDTLEYLRESPVHRRWHHDRITFGLLYAFAENFVLPLSHDEVVHGKGSLLARIPGDAWQQFATLRAYYAFMWAYPGKKLLFMGQEFAQGREWSVDTGLDWPQLDVSWHRGVQALVRDCNRGYRAQRALFERDCEAEGFRWIEVDDSLHSVFAWLRTGGDGASPVAVVTNFTPVPREAYRIGLPLPGRWREILNTDAVAYGGSGRGNAGAFVAESSPSHGFPCSAAITVPPLGTLWFVHEAGA